MNETGQSVPMSATRSAAVVLAAEVVEWPVRQAFSVAASTGQLHAHRAPIPEEEPLPGEEEPPEEDSVPHPDPVIREPGDTPPPQQTATASTFH